MLSGTWHDVVRAASVLDILHSGLKTIKLHYHDIHTPSVSNQNTPISKIATISRKPLPTQTKISSPIVSQDSSSWPQQFPQADNHLFISALGTTRAAAGGFENQRKIDYDLNLALAQEAKAKGTKVYVLISSSVANSQSMVGYPKMKGELEDAVAGLGFDVSNGLLHNAVYLGFGC